MSVIDRLVFHPLGDNPPQARLLYGQDVRESLKLIESNSIQVVCTSPPYWGLRDYGGEAGVWGGDPDCDHEWGEVGPAHHPGQVPWKKLGAAATANVAGQTAGSGQFCGKCAAWLGKFGLEPTPQLYVAHLVEIFEGIRRVLRPDGVVWLNIGDSYNAARNGGHPGGKKQWNPDQQKHPGQSGVNAPGLTSASSPTASPSRSRLMAGGSATTSCGTSRTPCRRASRTAALRRMRPCSCSRSRRGTGSMLGRLRSRRRIKCRQTGQRPATTRRPVVGTTEASTGRGGS